MTTTLDSARVKTRALELGFDLCGVAPAAGFPELRFLREWVDRGYSGEMAYMARTAARRGDVRHIVPSARSVIACAMVYNVDRPYSTESNDVQSGHVARYAWGDDYHEVMSRRLEALLSWMRATSDTPFDAKAYVDTGPVQERVYAQYAGLGWIGKNTCLINPERGSWLFLCEIISSLPLDPDPAALDQCGTCTLCLEACPTGALVEPYVMDATRCVSYLTIEMRGTIPAELRPGLGGHVYGCDICQEVCPWNAVPAVSTSAHWQPRAEWDRPKLLDLWRWSDQDLGAATRHSAMARAKLTGLRRNVAVAIGNCGGAEAAAVLDEVRPDAPSVQNPVVAEHVEWAKSRLRSATE